MRTISKLSFTKLIVPGLLIVIGVFTVATPAFGQANTDPWEFFDAQDFERNSSDDPADAAPVYASAANEITEYNSANGTSLGVPTNAELDERVIDVCLNRSGRDYAICVNNNLGVVLAAIREGTTVDEQEAITQRQDDIDQICNPDAFGISIEGALSSINRSFFLSLIHI